ncbi:zinc finger CCCH domain-containing protein 18-like, partial [Argonauta hians]
RPPRSKTGVVYDSTKFSYNLLDKTIFLYAKYFTYLETSYHLLYRHYFQSRQKAFNTSCILMETSVSNTSWEDEAKSDEASSSEESEHNKSEFGGEEEEEEEDEESRDGEVSDGIIQSNASDGVIPDNASDGIIPDSASLLKDIEDNGPEETASVEDKSLLDNSEKDEDSFGEDNEELGELKTRKTADAGDNSLDATKEMEEMKYEEKQDGDEDLNAEETEQNNLADSSNEEGICGNSSNENLSESEIKVTSSIITSSKDSDNNNSKGTLENFKKNEPNFDTENEQNTNEDNVKISPIEHRLSEKRIVKIRDSGSLPQPSLSEEHVELDYDEEDMEEPSTRTVSLEVKTDKEEKDGEWDKEKKEVVLSDRDDGEVDDDDDCEEGEIREPGSKKPFQKPLCRFFIKGQCTWGASCRFLHPGVNDKGNYRLIERPGFNNGFGMTTAIRGRRPPYGAAATWVPDVPLIPDLPPPREEPPAESAWERGLRYAKELMKKASQRKEQETNFEEKRLNLGLEEEREQNKENEQKRMMKDPYYDLEDEDDYYKSHVHGWQTGQYENFEVRWTREPDHINSAYHVSRERERERHPALLATREVQRQPYGSPVERVDRMDRMDRAERMERIERIERYDVNKRRDERREAREIRDARDVRDTREMREMQSTRDVRIDNRHDSRIDNRVDGRWRDDRRGDDRNSEDTNPQRPRADEWRDPWRRSKSPKSKRRNSPSRSWSRGRRRTRRSYSVSSYSSRSSSYSSYTSRSSYSRSSSYSSRSSISRSRSRSIPASAKRPVPQKLPPSSNSEKKLVPKTSEAPKSAVTVRSKMHVSPEKRKMSAFQSSGGLPSKQHPLPERGRRKERASPRLTRSWSGSSSGSSLSRSLSRSRSASGSRSRSRSRSSSSSFSWSRSASSISSLSSTGSSSSSGSADSEHLYRDIGSPASSRGKSPSHRFKDKDRSRQKIVRSSKLSNSQISSKPHSGLPMPSKTPKPESRQSGQQQQPHHHHHHHHHHHAAAETSTSRTSSSGPPNSGGGGGPVISSKTKDPLKLVGQKSNIKLTLISKPSEKESSTQSRKRSADVPIASSAKRQALAALSSKPPDKTIKAQLNRSEKPEVTVPRVKSASMMQASAMNSVPPAKISSSSSTPTTTKAFLSSMKPGLPKLSAPSIGGGVSGPPSAGSVPAPVPAANAASVAGATIAAAVSPVAAAAAGIAATKAKKSTSSRREELLKQLKAVEDAIARKRAKMN